MIRLLILSLTLMTLQSFALDATHFTISRVGAPYFIVDANAPSTITRAYVGFKIRNSSNSAVTYTALKFTITSITTSVTGQNYTIVSPATGITNIGTLAPGQSKTCYYYINYPANVTPQGTFNVSLSDATASAKTQSFVIRNRSSISANAGGTATQAITNQDLIGATVVDDVTYVVGNAQNGDENDFQVAVSSQFDPTKLTLVSTQIVSSSIPGIPAGTADSLYFISTGGSNGATVTVRWTFKITNFNFTIALLPSAGATSGNTNYKYALNTALGAGTPVTVSSSANPLVISKTSDKTSYLVNSTAIFTITIQNPGAYNISIDRITDQLPAGFVYQGLDVSSQVTASNSTMLPPGGSTGTVGFDGGVSSGGNTSYVIAPGTTLTLRFTATAPAAPASDLNSTASAYVGTTLVGTAQRSVSVVTVLPVQLVSFGGRERAGGTDLSWTTSREVNTGFFEIQRGNGGDFTTIARVNAGGNSTEAKKYIYHDALAPAGVSNYRLKIVDLDNQYVYSQIVSVTVAGSGQRSQVTLASPLFKQELKASLIAEQAGAVSIILMDMTGRPVASKNLLAVKGKNEVSLGNLSSLIPGNYALRITVDRRAGTFNVVKTN